MTQKIPDTENIEVAIIAAALEIAPKSSDVDDGAAAFAKAYKAIKELVRQERELDILPAPTE